MWLCVCVCDPCTAVCQSPLSMEFSRQAYWSGLPWPLPGSLPDLVIEPASSVSPALQADALPTEPSGKPNTIDTMHKIDN